MFKHAVIPTYGRPCLTDCIAAISDQVDEVLLIGHNFVPDILPENCYVIPYTEEVPNISEMWNIGIKCAYPDSFIAILNDDAIVQPDWFERVTTEMQAYGAAAGCMSGVDKLRLQVEHSPALPRLDGFAFILDNSYELLLDEQFQWWWGDTDLDWRARRVAGTVIVPGEVEHRHPNSTTTGILAEIAAQDRDRFVAKWGSAPW